MIVQKILRFVRLSDNGMAKVNQIVSKGFNNENGNYFIVYTGSTYEIYEHLSKEEFDKYKLNDIYDVINSTFAEC